MVYQREYIQMIKTLKQNKNAEDQAWQLHAFNTSSLQAKVDLWISGKSGLNSETLSQQTNH